ncbi:hypothetical protein I3842_09G015400 [Carya illinoinensis]|uniref:Sm domain-containing protein n=1 Tax=Carya illinoinensis TaxID=32201 RepID=A0A922J470_CARIL|nr:hypothetical protein I3842_09G015400 [Carya illinoinensis]
MSRSGQLPDLKNFLGSNTLYSQYYYEHSSCAKEGMIDAYIKLNANRMVVGTLRGFDQFMNLVVDNTMEVNGNEKNYIGTVIRGNSVVTVEALEPVNRT